MDSESKAEKPQRRKCIWGPGGCALAGAVVLLLVGLGGLALHLYDRGWERRLQARLDELRAAGQPVTWEEVLAAREPIPEEENSALILLEAFPRLVEPEGTYAEELVDIFAEPFASGNRHSLRVRELVRSHLEANSKALELIHQAAQFSRGAYPLEPVENPFELEIEYLTHVRPAARLCAVEAVLHAGAGDSEKAVRSLKAGRRLSASLGECPTLMEAFVRIAVGAIWREGLERTLELCEMPGHSLEMMREEIGREAEELSLELGFFAARSEGAYVAKASAQELADFVFGEVTPMLRLYAALPAWRHKDVLAFIHLMDRVIHASAMRPREEWQEASKGLQQEYAKLPTYCQFARVLVPAMAMSLKEHVRAKAALRVATTALAVEQWRLRQGGWPESLEELVPHVLDAVPEDLFSDDVIQYLKRQDGVVIYSVGPDGEDNLGLSAQEARESAAGFVDTTWDITFRLLNLELRGAETLTFRDDVMNSYVNLQHLEDAGFTREKLEALGFSADDLKELERR